jgi:hypothetical protein
MDQALLQTLTEHSRQRGYPVDRLMMSAPADTPDRPAGDDGVKPAEPQKPG